MLKFISTENIKARIDDKVIDTKEVFYDASELKNWLSRVPESTILIRITANLVVTDRHGKRPQNYLDEMIDYSINHENDLIVIYDTNWIQSIIDNTKLSRKLSTSILEELGNDEVLKWELSVKGFIPKDFKNSGALLKYLVRTYPEDCIKVLDEVRSLRINHERVRVKDLYYFDSIPKSILELSEVTGYNELDIILAFNEIC